MLFLCVFILLCIHQTPSISFQHPSSNRGHTDYAIGLFFHWCSNGSKCITTHMHTPLTSGYSFPITTHSTSLKSFKSRLAYFLPSLSIIMEICKAPTLQLKTDLFLLQHYVASIVLVLKPYTHFIEGTVTARLTLQGSCLVDMHGDAECPFSGITNYSSLEEGCPKAMFGMCVYM